jgi:hypothetical protein
MSRLTKDEILARAKSAPVAKTIAALGGGEVLVRKMSAAQAETYFDSVQITNADGKREYVNKESRQKLIALCVVDEGGAPAFAVDELSALDNDVIAGLFVACQEVNGMNEKALVDAKKD